MSLAVCDYVHSNFQNPDLRYYDSQPSYTLYDDHRCVTPRERKIFYRSPVSDTALTVLTTNGQSNQISILDSLNSTTPSTPRSFLIITRNCGRRFAMKIDVIISWSGRGQQTNRKNLTRGEHADGAADRLTGRKLAVASRC